jgi:DNA-directed RNA polymerase subunit H (RpoH/RPB5)
MEELAEKLLQLRSLDRASTYVVCTEQLTQGILDAALHVVSESPGLTKLIIIYEILNEKKSAFSKKIAFFKTLFDLDVFERAALEILIRGHRLLPVFTKLDLGTQRDLLKKYSAENLPSMCLSDPMTQLYDFKLGEIIRITRKDGKIYYRQIIED